LIHNCPTPKIEIDAETYAAKADGELSFDPSARLRPYKPCGHSRARRGHPQGIIANSRSGSHWQLNSDSLAFMQLVAFTSRVKTPHFT